MDDQDLPDAISHNVAAWDGPHNFDVNDVLWTMPLDQTMQQDYPPAEGDFPFTWPDLTLFNAAEATWSSTMPMVSRQPSLAFNTFFTNQTAPLTFFQPNALQPNALQPSALQPNTLQSNSLFPKISGQKPAPRKRERKAAIMTDELWEPALDRIRYLYVIEEKTTINEIKDIVNKEFEFNATVRQYKEKIKKMRLRRNCTTAERKTILRQVHYRQVRLGKVSKYVRVRGRIVGEETIARWWKEPTLVKSLSYVRSPSPLPTEISIRTACRLNSPILAQRILYDDSLSMNHESIVARLLDATQHSNQVVDAQQARRDFNEMTSTPIRRLLRYAQGPSHVIDSQEARAMFNDLQLIFRNEYITGQKLDAWTPSSSVADVLTQVRNLMNVTKSLHVGGKLKETRELLYDSRVRGPETKSSKITNRHAAWQTPHGKVQVSFWAEPTDFNNEIRADSFRTGNKMTAGRLTIVPNRNNAGRLPFRVLADFVPRLDPTATITFQAMVPNGSLVFNIARYRTVTELIQLLETGTASLTDHDEQGRSLLCYAIWGTNVDICKFLVAKNADVNAIEPDGFADIRPVHTHRFSSVSLLSEIGLRNFDRCINIMLRAGADISLGMEDGGYWTSAFMFALERLSLSTVKQMLDFGDPFFNLDDPSRSSWGEDPALISLAHACGCFPGKIDVVDRAILLLNRKANISCRDEKGNTVLHVVLKCKRLHEWVRDTPMEEYQRDWEKEQPGWEASFTAPRDLLATFISAGADVYATNNHNQTPSMMALYWGRTGEWIEALELCGYDSQEVVEATVYKPSRVHQTSKLSFHDYCEQRLERQYPTLLDEGRVWELYYHSGFEETEIEASQSESDYDERFAEGSVYETNDDEEVRVTGDDSEISLSGEKMVIPSRQGSIHHGMDMNLNSQGNYDMGGVEQMVYAQVRGHDDLFDNDWVGSDNFEINDTTSTPNFFDALAIDADGLVDTEAEGMYANLDISHPLEEEVLNDTVWNELERMDFNFDFDDFNKGLNDGEWFM